MPTKLQITKNLELSEKLLDYLSNNPQQNLKQNVSYVVISSNDTELNEINQNMIPSLIKEGKAVVKALETNDKTSPWKFITL